MIIHQYNTTYVMKFTDLDINSVEACRMLRMETTNRDYSKYVIKLYLEYKMIVLIHQPTNMSITN